MESETHQEALTGARIPQRGNDDDGHGKRQTALRIAHRTDGGTAGKPGQRRRRNLQLRFPHASPAGGWQEDDGDRLRGRWTVLLQMAGDGRMGDWRLLAGAGKCANAGRRSRLKGTQRGRVRIRRLLPDGLIRGLKEVCASLSPFPRVTRGRSNLVRPSGSILPGNPGDRHEDEETNEDKRGTGHNQPRKSHFDNLPLERGGNRRTHGYCRGRSVRPHGGGTGGGNADASPARRATVRTLRRTDDAPRPGRRTLLPRLRLGHRADTIE